jgi:hypothetical protein
VSGEGITKASWNAKYITHTTRNSLKNKSADSLHVLDPKSKKPEISDLLDCKSDL